VARRDVALASARLGPVLQKTRRCSARCWRDPSGDTHQGAGSCPSLLLRQNAARTRRQLDIAPLVTWTAWPVRCRRAT